MKKESSENLIESRYEITIKKIERFSKIVKSNKMSNVGEEEIEENTIEEEIYKQRTEKEINLKAIIDEFNK